MRWQRRDGRTISPAVFICAAEENGTIIPLTRHLFELIIRDAKGWEVSAPFHLGVNIAAAHLQQPSFITDVLRLWVALDHDFCLVLEITERSLVEDTALAAEKLNALREKGCQVAVDDFGTGYCSLSLLQNLPVDYLKIDKSFIDTLTSAGADTPILDTIVALSQRLGLATIAEGSVRPIRQNGCRQTTCLMFRAIFTPDRCRHRPFISGIPDKAPTCRRFLNMSI